MLNLRRDLNIKEQEALHSIPLRRRKEGAVDTKCYIPEEI
jgi:hypothetical protein